MHSQPSDTTKKPVFSPFRRVAAVTVISVAVFVSVLSFSKTVHASLFSLLNMVMGNQQASAEVKQTSLADSQVSSAIVLQPSSGFAQTLSASDIPPLEADTTLSAEVARSNATSTDDLNTQISIYTVRAGDNISGVAKMFNVSVSTILWANGLSGKSALRPGQTLVILPVTGLTYVVKKGDTVDSIAKKYHADAQDILNYNDIALGTSLAVGDQVIIPDAEIPTVAVTVSATPGKITKVPAEPLLDGWDWPSYPGYYACPVPGARLSQGLHGHNAVDLAIGRGTAIHAAASGTVIIDRSNGAWNGGYGNFVVILHANGTQTLYAHMSKSTVYNGQNVAQGQTIGYVGMTGLTTGPHVHFEVRGAQNPFADVSLCR